MRRKNPRRFGVHAVKGGLLQVATRRYYEFLGELSYLATYLNSRLLPTEPEQVQIADVVSNLQNLLEFESEELIRAYVKQRGTAKERSYVDLIDTGYAASNRNVIGCWQENLL
jgi:hypothetical protein